MGSWVFFGLARWLVVATGEMSRAELRAAPHGVSTVPMLLLANNLWLAGFVPLAIVLQRLLYGVPAGAASSVDDMFRWDVLRAAARRIVPWIGVPLLVSALAVAGGGDGHRVGWVFLAVVLLTQPLQAAGEEYAFRGLLPRVIGSWCPGPRSALVVGTVVPTGAFVLGHRAGDPWLWLFYASFGTVASVLAWRTGGLEAGVLLHATWNTCSFVVAAVAVGPDQFADRSAGAAGPGILVAVGYLLLLLVLTVRSRRVRAAAALRSGANRA